MRMTKENFDEKDPRCRVVRFNGKLYMAYDDGDVFNIIGEYAGFKLGRLFFFHRYKGETKTVVGELKDLRKLIREDSVLTPATWGASGWVEGIANERMLPKNTWDFRRQHWICK